MREKLEILKKRSERVSGRGMVVLVVQMGEGEQIFGVGVGPWVGFVV